MLCSALVVMTCASACADLSTLNRFQPDLSIAASPGPFVGGDIYNSTGWAQIAPATVTPPGTQTFILHLQNDGYWWDNLRLTGQGSTAELHVVYFDAPVAGNNVTASVTGGGWVSRRLAPTLSVTLRMEVTPTGAAVGSTTKTRIVTGSSVTLTSQRDVVKAATTIGAVRQPDLLIADEGYIGNGIYNCWGAGQTVSLDADAGDPATYQILLQNDGNITDQFKVKSVTGPTGWDVRFFSAAWGGTDITYAVTHDGWLTSPIARDGQRAIRVEVTPDSMVGFGNGISTLVEAKSFVNPWKRDAIKAITTRVLWDD